MIDHFTIREVTPLSTSSVKKQSSELSDSFLRRVDHISVSMRETDEFGPIGEVVIEIFYED